MCARAAGPSPPPCRAHENARNLACCRRTTHPGHEQSSHPPGQQTVPGSVSREPEQVVLVIKDRARQPDTGQSESRGVTERLAYLSAATHVARAAAVALPSIATPSRSSPYCWEARRALVRPAPRFYPRPGSAAASAPVGATRLQLVEKQGGVLLESLHDPLPVLPDQGASSHAPPLVGGVAVLLPLLSAVPHVLQRDVPVLLCGVRHDPARLAQVSQEVLEHLPCPRWILHQPCLGARPPLLPAARRYGGIRPGRGDVAEAVTAAVARSGTPAPAKGAFTAEKRPLLPAGWLSVAGVILRLGHSS